MTGCTVQIGNMKGHFPNSHVKSEQSSASAEAVLSRFLNKGQLHAMRA